MLHSVSPFELDVQTISNHLDLYFDGMKELHSLSMQQCSSLGKDAEPASNKRNFNDEINKQQNKKQQNYLHQN